MPMGGEPQKLAPSIAKLHELAEAAGRPTPEVVSLGGLPPGQPERGGELLHALEDVGVTRFAMGTRYEDADDFRRGLDDLCAAREAAGWDPA